MVTLKESLRLLNRHTPVFELEKDESRVLNTGRKKTIPVPVLDTRKLLEPFPPLPSPVLSSDDCTFIYQTLGISYEDPYNLYNLHTFELYNLVLRLHEHLSIKKVYLRPTDYIDDIIHDFENDLRSYVDGYKLEIDFDNYIKRLNDWSETGVEVHINKHGHLTNIKSQYDQEWVGQHGHGNIYASRQGLVDTILYAIDCLAAHNTQYSIKPNVSSVLYSKMNMVKTHNDKVCEYATRIENINRAVPKSDTDGPLEEKVGKLYVTNFIDQGKRLEDHVNTSAHNLQSINELHDTLKENGDHTLKCLNTFLDNIDRRIKNINKR